MDLAERIAWHMVGPGSLKLWRERLPNRPDWQASIELVRSLLNEQRLSNCPWDGIEYSSVPGYVSGYGCPVCGAISFNHVNIEELPA